jgi:hypothetical protein
MIRVTHARPGRERNRWLSMNGWQKLAARLWDAHKQQKKLEMRGGVPERTGPVLIHKGRKP